MMAKRSFYTQIGINKKDLKEMGGCLTLLLPLILLLMLFM